MFSDLRRRLFFASCLCVMAAGATAFSFYGAYRVRSAETLAMDLAAFTVDALQPVLEQAADNGEEGLLAAMQSAVADGAVRGIAVLRGEEERPLSVPGGTVLTTSLDQPLCSSCHAVGEELPHRVLVAGPAGSSLVHIFRKSGVDGHHLTLTLDSSSVMAAARWELLVAFLCTAGAGLVLAAASWWALGIVLDERSWDVELAGRGRELKSVGRSAENLGTQRSLTIWNHCSEEFHRYLDELQQGVERDKEAGREVLRAAREYGATLEGIRNHLNGIASSTSDNSTSLIEMSSSIDEVANSADQLSQNVASSASAVFEMVQSIGEVSERVGALAKETDTTASSLAQIDASTREIEINAREATALSGRMADAATDGFRAVQETLEGIHSSYQVIQETASAMDELRAASGAIGGVVKIINEINDKTKLLSLNAAIIAAQAGDHGKSFAVVAHEIKNLSDRTAASTGEISRLIRGIREQMEVATEAVSRGKGATGRSVDLAEKAGEALRRILHTARVSDEMTRKILQATEEQSRNSQKVMSSMEQVGALVTYVRQAATEHRSSGESVSMSSELMRDLTEQVKLATAEQAEVSRYISEAISAIDRNLQGVVEMVEEKRRNTHQLLHWANELVGQGESGIRGIEAIGAQWNHIDSEMRSAVEVRGERLVSESSEAAS